MTRSRILLSAALVVAAATASSGALPGNLTSDRNATRVSRGVQAESLLVSAVWVAAHLKDANLVVLHVDHMDSAYAEGHIPGARLLDYMWIIENRDNRGTELPSVDSLRRLFEAAGVKQLPPVKDR